MSKEEILVSLFFIFIMIFCWFYLEWLMNEKSKCIEKNHDWKFKINSKGNTGDLGFGIKGYWNTNHYYCTKCAHAIVGVD